MTRALALLLLLSACTELPLMDGTISPSARARAAPELIALDPILAEGRRTSRAQAAQGPLRARRTALSKASIASPATAGLEERGRILRERAARLRAEPV